MKLLIEGGADVNFGSKTGLTPLMFATSSGKTKILDMLIIAGAYVNKRGSNSGTALRNLGETGNVEYLKYFIKAGADVNFPFQRRFHSSNRSGSPWS